MDDPESYYIKSWLNFFTILIIFGFLQIFRRHQRLTDREIDRGLISPSDYAIMITKLPKGEYDETTLRNLVTELWEKVNPSSQKLEIVQIIIAYNISEYIEVVKKKERLRVKKTKAEGYFKIKGNYPGNLDMEEINREISELQNEKNKLETELNKGAHENSCGVAFVTLSCQEGYH